MAGIVFMRYLSRGLLSAHGAKAARFRGSNRCYRTAFGQTATLLTVNNSWLWFISDLNIVMIVRYMQVSTILISFLDDPDSHSTKLLVNI